MTAPQQFDLLSGEYVIRPLSFSGLAFTADVQHVRRRGDQVFYTSVAYLTGFKHPAADMTYPHWNVRLFIDSRVRYEIESGTSTLLWDVNLQSAEHSADRGRLESLRDSELPSVHPDLMQELGPALVRVGWASEPLHLLAYAATPSFDAELGEVFHDSGD